MWAQTLYPVVLPAIRIAIAAALRTMVQALDQALERSLSFRSWRWRWEAWRTRRPLAEVVLLRTLIYRVEQVLLIDRNSGLLLQAVALPEATCQDTHLISAMLAAIQDFIHDSFQVDNRAGIRELHLGDFSLWIEEGQYAAIAAAVRGNAPAELRATLRTAVDVIEREYEPELRAFQGDSRPLEGCRETLIGCLESKYQIRKSRSRWKAFFCLCIVAAAALLWAGLRLRESGKWNRALAELKEAPGIAVTQQSQRAGTYVVEGLRDPLAEPPQNILARHGIDATRVSMRLRPFVSLDPAIEVRRALLTLHPPGSVSLGVDQDVLVVHGRATHEWILLARRVGSELRIPGIREVRTSDVQDTDLDSLRALIERDSVQFPSDSSAMGAEQARETRVVAAELRQWMDGVTAIGQTPKCLVLGYTDATGTAAHKLALSKDRAAHVAAVLDSAGVSRQMLQVEGRSTGELHRRVVFRLLIQEQKEVR
jgi:OOP family OmpA-OmpF porin